MKQLLLAGLLAIGSATFAQSGSSPAKAAKPEDQIRQYWFVLLTRGENRTQDTATAMAIQKAHMDNINKLYNEGKIKVAGPFGKNEQGWQGVFIFDCPTREEVERLLQTDRAVSSGRLAFSITPWYTAPIGSFVPGMPEKKY